MIKISIALIALAFLLCSPAEARKHHYHHRHHVNGYVNGYVKASYTYQIAQYLPHPAGCPRTAFCGCGAAADLGKQDRSLWLAANWYKFPRSAPGPNTVGVRPHHVFVLKQAMGGSNWLVADYNSGGHQSRLHVRSISGYTIVNPFIEWPSMR